MDIIPQTVNTSENDKANPPPIAGVALASSGPQTNRRELDFYPTPPDVTHALMLFLPLPASRIYEPACGDGAMSRVIEAYGHTVISSDLRHTSYGTGGVDYLASPAPVCDAIITNPPFASSEAFIRKALTECPIVAMLLKSQFWHAQKRYALFADNPPAYILPLTWRPDFLNGERGGAPTMECLWTVWIRGTASAKYIPLVRPSIKTAGPPRSLPC
jgi:hypothetical protein